MTTFVYMDNYRGFSNALIPLKRVNFLVGENSTGKTSFLQLLQTLCYPPFWFFEPRFGTPGSDLRHFQDLISVGSKNRSSFSIGAISVSKQGATQDHGMIVTYKNFDGRPQLSRVSIIQGESVRTVDGRLWASKKGDKYRTRLKECKNESTTTSLILRANSQISIHDLNSGFVDRELTEEQQASPLFIRCEEHLFGSTQSKSREVKIPFPFTGKFVDLAPIRTKPRRTYDSPQTEYSAEGEHTPYIIKKKLSSKSQSDEFIEFLEKAGKDSGLFQSIKVKNYGAGPLAPFEMQIILGQNPLGLENVGYGVSQSLPVIVEMFVRPRRTTFTIQQPEVHLHPRAQATFGDLIAQLARSDEKRFFIETHSDFTIDRFRLNVRRNGTVPGQLLFFERKDNGNQVTAIPIDSNGNLPDDQPEAYRLFFFNESLSILS